MSEDEKLVRDILSVISSRLFVALAHVVDAAGGARPSIHQVIQSAEMFGVYPPILASFFGYGLPLGRSIRTDRPEGYVNLLEPGAIARSPQSWEAWMGHACFVIDQQANVRAVQVN